MYNITIVGTHHSEFGRCNSEELYKILVSIKPDIIFEELNKDLFDRFYKENSIPFEPPEIKAVKRYVQLLLLYVGFPFLVQLKSRIFYSF